MSTVRAGNLPRECTKLLLPVVQLLRLQGVCFHVYLDDCLMRADLLQMATSHAQLVMRVLQHLGWIINFEMSELMPTQEFNFIGMHYRTQDLTVAPMPKMRMKVQAIINHWRLALDIHKILGKIQYMALLVPRRRLRFRPMQWWASESWDQTSEDWAQRITVPDWVIHHLSWWASPAVSRRSVTQDPRH